MAGKKGERPDPGSIVRYDDGAGAGAGTGTVGRY